jgi:hypothetical protein
MVVAACSTRRHGAPHRRQVIPAAWGSTTDADDTSMGLSGAPPSASAAARSRCRASFSSPRARARRCALGDSFFLPAMMTPTSGRDRASPIARSSRAGRHQAPRRFVVCRPICARSPGGLRGKAGHCAVETFHPVVDAPRSLCAIDNFGSTFDFRQTAGACNVVRSRLLVDRDSRRDCSGQPSGAPQIMLPREETAVVAHVPLDSEWKTILEMPSRMH